MNKKVLEILMELKKLFPNPKTILNYVTPWELLVAVILSARNTDKKVNEVTNKLFKKYKSSTFLHKSIDSNEEKHNETNTDLKPQHFEKVLDKTIKDYANADLNELEKDLGQLGLFRQKAKFVKGSATIILDKHKGEMPKTMSGLTELPGVGRKTANIILGNVFKIYEGIAVDTHVTRLSKLFGLTQNKAPEKIEQDLMKLLPKSEWFNFTNSMIAYGRNYCKASCKHTDCPLKNFISVSS